MIGTLLGRLLLVLVFYVIGLIVGWLWPLASASSHAGASSSRRATGKGDAGDAQGRSSAHGVRLSDRVGRSGDTASSTASSVARAHGSSGPHVSAEERTSPSDAGSANRAAPSVARSRAPADWNTGTPNGHVERDGKRDGTHEEAGEEARRPGLGIMGRTAGWSVERQRHEARLTGHDDGDIHADSAWRAQNVAERPGRVRPDGRRFGFAGRPVGDIDPVASSSDPAPSSDDAMATQGRGRPGDAAPPDGFGAGELHGTVGAGEGADSPDGVSRSAMNPDAAGSPVFASSPSAAIGDGDALVASPDDPSDSAKLGGMSDGMSGPAFTGVPDTQDGGATGSTTSPVSSTTSGSATDTSSSKPDGATGLSDSTGAPDAALDAAPDAAPDTSPDDLPGNVPGDAPGGPRGIASSSSPRVTSAEDRDTTRDLADDPMAGGSPDAADAGLASATEQGGPGEAASGGVDPDAAGDDLKRIRGIGPQNEQRLKAAGVTLFTQIAAWTPDDARRMGEMLRFGGRIEREDWIGQAHDLAAGRDTEFSRRVDAANVRSSLDRNDPRFSED